MAAGRTMDLPWSRAQARQADRHWSAGKNNFGGARVASAAILIYDGSGNDKNYRCGSKKY